MRKIGLHIRVPHTIIDAVQYAQKLHVPIFQLFLLDQIARRPLSIDEKAEKLFHTLKEEGITPFVHGSYFMNLANLKERGRKILMREFSHAQKIGAPFLILHPGSATGTLTHEEGLAQLASVINDITKNDSTTKIVLENTAHGGSSIGSDLKDFKHLQRKLTHPEKIAFCIDTAHAHTFGYDLSTPEKQEAFITTIEETIGIQNVALIHLNDSYHDVGSRIDKHAPFGKGTIGADALRAFALHPKLSHIPLILELPELAYEQDHDILQTVREWHEKKEHS